MVAAIVPGLCLTLLIFQGCSANRPQEATSAGAQTGRPTEQFEEQRRRMVERQIRARGITDRAVLEAMLKVPRHRFVPAENAQLAYQDHPLPIGKEQTISQPYIVAYMSEAVEITKNEKVLEIGTGSGYQAAILGELAREVYTIEIIPELAERARRTLSELGYKNVHVKTGNGYEGWAEHAPYDGIVVTAAPDEVPKALVDQLAISGKMVIPVGVLDQEMMIITRTPQGVIEKRTIPVRFVPMTGKPKQ
jgi:protein-L-isoaspartate(D-aspartate) O-methyltransferase